METGKPELAVTSPPSTHVHKWRTGGLILLCIIAVALALHLLGIQRDLPLTPEIDEPLFVKRAANIAATGDLNPGWFGNPGSTVFYPLAAIYHLWNAVAHNGTLFRPDASLLTTLQSNGSEFYLLGRLLTILYAVMSVPLVYLVGRRAFSERVALIGAGLSVLYPIAVTHAQMVRSDSAAVFFGLLGLWLSLRLYDRPTAGNQILAGLAIGVAISSRYFMAALIPVLIAVDSMILWRQMFQRQRPTSTWLGLGSGILAVVVGFALTTPYFFLDFDTAWSSVTREARSIHLGADGLSPRENLVWYLTSAIPGSITLPQTALAAFGGVLAVWRRQPKQVLLVGFAVVFLLGISRSPLHWQRWIIPILPLLALLAAYGLNGIFEHLSVHARLRLSMQRALILAAVLLIAAWPAYQLVLQDIGQARPSTRVLAREWMVENLPVGSQIAVEWYTAPLHGTDFSVSGQFSLARHPMESYLDDGYHYLVASSLIYDRYFAEPDRYTAEIAFYETLFAEERLVQKFEPSNTRGGPVIRIYELGEP